MIDSAPTQVPVLPGMPARTAAGSTTGATEAEGVATDGAAPPVFAQLLAALRVEVDGDRIGLLDPALAEAEAEAEGEGDGEATPGDMVPAMPILTVHGERGVLISPLELGGGGEAEHGLTLDLGAGLVDAPRADAAEPVVAPGGAIEVVPAGELVGRSALADRAGADTTMVDGAEAVTADQQMPQTGADDGPDAALESDEDGLAALVRSSARDEIDNGQSEIDVEVGEPTDTEAEGPAGLGDGLLDDEGSTGDRAGIGGPDLEGFDDAAAEQTTGEFESVELGADVDVDVPAGRIETARGTAGSDAAPAAPTIDRAGPAPAAPAAPIAVEQVAAESNESAPLVIDRVALRNVPTVVVDRVRALDPTGGMNRAVVRLDPPDLGQIVIEVVGRGDEIAVVARADTAEAARALVRQRAEIQAAVEALGLSVSDFDVHHGDGNDGQAQQGRDQRPNRPAADGGPGGYQTAELPEPEGELFL